MTWQAYLPASGVAEVTKCKSNNAPGQGVRIGWGWFKMVKHRLNSDTSWFKQHENGDFIGYCGDNDDVGISSECPPLLKH